MFVLGRDGTKDELVESLLGTIHGDLCKDPGFELSGATLFTYENVYDGGETWVAYALLSGRGGGRWAVSFDPSRRASTYHRLPDPASYFRWAQGVKPGYWKRILVMP